MDFIIPTFNDKWDDWECDGFPSRSAALTLALAQDPRVHRVLVVDVPSSVFSLLRPGRPVARPFALREPRPNIAVLDQVRVLPRERHYPLALEINGALHDASLASAVGGAARELGLDDPVAFHAGPLTTSLFGRLGERLRVYDAVDEWRAHPAFERMRPTFERAYATIRAGADLVTAVSRPLADVFEGGRAKVAVVRNGVGAAFRHPGPAPSVPSDLDALPRPIVGYTGALEERVDVQLLEWLARSLPHVTFCLVGPVSSPAHFGGLGSIRNVRFLGAKNHEVLADYVRSFDVCVMPHRDTPLTRMMDPIKLREYIASGRPVVMTAVGEWERFRDLAHVAGTREEFKTELERVLTTDGCGRRASASYGRENSWASRATELLDLIERLPTRRSAGSGSSRRSGRPGAASSGG